MASLISKASLLMVPSVYEDGTLYNVLPSGNKAPDETGNNNGYDQTRADFTFSRGSNLSATRIGPSGLIEKGRENLLLQSNQFDTTWLNDSSITHTSGQSGYDGSNDAWLITKGAFTYQKLYQDVTASGLWTFSIYAKEGTLGKLTLRVNDDGTRAIFNLDDGSVYGFLDPSSKLVDYGSSDDLGSGWRRYHLTYNGSLTRIQVYPDFGEADAGNIYIQNAQLEAGLVATDYIETGSVSGTAGVLENTPRIDYSSGAGALLLEPSRSNLITYGNYFNGWSKTSASVTTNAATSPDGLQNASKLVEASGSSFHFIGSTPTIASGAATFSFYAKAAERTSVSAFLTQSGNNGANFDLSAETATAQGTGNTASIESVGNGWYRCIVSNSGGAQIASQVRIGIKNGALDSYVGDGTSGVYIYGAQCEQASHVSSYIPTHGAAVTRGADSCSVTGVSDVIGQTEGTIYYEGSVKSDGANVVFFEIVKNTDTSNTMTLYINDTNDKLEMYNPDAGPNVNVLKDGNNQGVDFKLALAYKANDYVCYVNGVQTYIDTAASVPSSMNGVHIGQNRSGLETGLNIVKQSMLFNERLSNTELATLTTL